MSGKRGRSYLQRQHLLDLGSDAERFLTELVHLRPRRWHDDVARLHELLQAHGDAPLAQAFRQAVELGTITVDAIRCTIQRSDPLFNNSPEADR